MSNNNQDVQETKEVTLQDAETAGKRTPTSGFNASTQTAASNTRGLGNSNVADERAAQKGEDVDPLKEKAELIARSQGLGTKGIDKVHKQLQQEEKTTEQRRKDADKNAANQPLQGSNMTGRVVMKEYNSVADNQADAAAERNQETKEKEVIRSKEKEKEK